MAAPYESQSMANYNLNPPDDTGAATALNQVLWSKIKTKLSDPNKTLSEAINTECADAFTKVVGGKGITSVATNYTVQTTDQGGWVIQTASSTTTTTPDATAVGSPFVFAFRNASTGDVTLDGSGSQTIDGATAITVAAGESFFLNTDGTNWFSNGRKTGNLPRSYLAGLGVSNGTDATNDIDIAVGSARDSTNVDDMILSSVLTKQLDAAWAVGSNAGGLDTGSIANTTYHLWLIKRSDTGVVDALFSTSATAPTMPTNYDRKRRIFSFIRTGGAIRLFLQEGDYFHYKAPAVDASSGALTSADLSFDVSSGIPTGFRFRGLFEARVAHGSTVVHVLVRCPNATTVAASGSSAACTLQTRSGGAEEFAQFEVVTDTSSNVVGRADQSSTTLGLTVLGYFDRRGRDD